MASEKPNSYHEPAPDEKVSLLLEDLSALEDYIYDLLTFVPIPISFVSPLGVILEVNPAFEKISNFSKFELPGQSIEILFRKEDAEKIIHESLEKGLIDGMETTFLPKDAKEKIILVFSKTRRDEKGEVVGFFLSLFEITKQKLTERELRSTQTALLNILEDVEEARKRAEIERNRASAIVFSLTDGLLVLDRENRVMMTNPQLESFFNVKTEKITGRSIADLAPLNGFQELLNLLGPEIGEIFRKELPLNEGFILEVSTVPLKIEGQKIGTIIILHDISREKMVEKLKTEFVSIAAHQLRTPLSAIKWTLRMMLDGDLGVITEEQREYLNKTFVSNERMIELVNSLLNVTRIEEGRFLYKPVQAHIEDILNQVLESCRAVVERKKIKLEIKKPKERFPQVLVDIEKISLAIQNLIDNATKYTLGEGKITVSLEMTDMGIQLSVQDTGVGIPKDQQDRVFSRFFRGKNVIRLDTTGTGLGLFICKNIIESHGGKIWFESEEGKGTTFYFTLPVIEKTEK